MAARARPWVRARARVRRSTPPPAPQTWHGVKLHQPDWQASSHSLAVTAEIPGSRVLLHLILNAYDAPLDFELPSPGANRTWRRWIDTSVDSPTTSCRWRTRDRSRGPRIGRRRTAWRSSTRHLPANTVGLYVATSRLSRTVTVCSPIPSVASQLMSMASFTL